MAIETAGTYGKGTNNIAFDIDRRITEATGDQRETFWFMQSLMLLAFFAANENGNVILKDNNLSTQHSSVGEFPLHEVVRFSMDSSLTNY